MTQATKGSSSVLDSTAVNTERAVRLSVVIVAWNAKKYVMECLHSLEANRGDVCVEVIVVDNASSDGIPEVIEKEFPSVTLIRNEANLGFARANNIGINRSKGEYVALINSDVKFVSNCFEPMLKYMAEHPDVGMLGPQMLGPDGLVARSSMRFPTIWNSLCRALNFDSFFKTVKFFKGQLMLDFKHDVTTDVEVLAGWFWMVRRSALERVGLLDDQFFMYGEDVDWCYRFHRAGERVVFFADARAWHHGGASSSTSPLRFSVEKERASRQLIRKHHGRLVRFGLLITGVLNYGIRAIGYGLLSVIRRNDREESLSKFRRSITCLQWLIWTDRR
jgi:GT2 family glycosyltransferase